MTHQTIVAGLPLTPGTQTRQYHAKSSSIYALPADGEEYDRLEGQHRLLMHLYGGPVIAPVKESLATKPMRIIDVGCGPGSWIKTVAAEYPNVECHATDFAATFTSAEPRIAFVVGDILKGLPYPAEHFDLVHMRFFTGALKAEEWPQAVRELLRICKTGGWIQMTEPDGEIRSAKGVTPAIADWNERGLRGNLKQRGGNPFAAIQLEGYMREAGLQVVMTETVSAPMSPKAGAVGELMAKDYDQLIATLTPVLAKTYDMTREEVVQWGRRVMEDTEAVEGFHNFVTVCGMK